MSALALTISNISIRQDSEGRYCLNDLHKAAGNEPKHKPSEWLRNQQTKDLIQEIEKAGIPAIQSKQQLGTFAVKELVYSYAMWISPAFTLKVIRAYDALVTNPIALPNNPKAPRAKFAIPGGLSLQSQDLINDAVAERVAALPKDKQVSATIAIRSAVTTKYDLKGVKHGYKNIPDEQCANVINLIARLPLDADNYLTYSQDELAELIQQEAAKLLPPPEPETTATWVSLSDVERLIDQKINAMPRSPYQPVPGYIRVVADFRDNVLIEMLSRQGYSVTIR